MKYLILFTFALVGCFGSGSYYETKTLPTSDGKYVRVMDCANYMDDCTVLVGRNRMLECKHPVILLDEAEYRRGRLTPRNLYC